MIDLIYLFLNGNGAYETGRELIVALFKILIKFTVNLANLFLEPLFNLIFSIFPFDLDTVGIYLSQLFNYILPYCNFILNSVLVSDTVLFVVIGSILFRISVRKDSYFTKLILKWYHMLVP